MIEVTFTNGTATGFNVFGTVADWTERAAMERAGTLQTRSDWTSFEQVEKIAAELSAATGKRFIPVDAGEWVSPRYDVIEAPIVGAEVSSAFNGDYYPTGKITRVSPDCRVVTATDEHTGTVTRYYRRRLSGAWINERTWSMVSGHRTDKNPSF